MYNIEDDCMTCNSYVVFSQIKRPSQDHFFLYVDRHGNWVVGESVSPVISFSFISLSLCRQMEFFHKKLKSFIVL